MAEQSVIKKVEDILTCSLCLGVLVDPRTLTCLHSCCLGCITELKPLATSTLENDESLKDDSTPTGATTNETPTHESKGYDCPQCRRFTPVDKVRKVHLIIQLLDAYHTAHDASSDTKCEKCKEHKAAWKCYSCKKIKLICDECKVHHDDFASDHNCISFDELSQAKNVIDTPVFCDKHPKNELEVYCNQCEVALCVLCKIFQHNDHSAEPIEEALKRLLPQFHGSEEKMQENMRSFSEVIRDLQDKKERA